MFIDMFVGQIYLGTLRDNEGKANSFRTRALALQKGASGTRKDEFADRTSLSSGLFFQPPVERGWNVHGRTNGFLLHDAEYPIYAINMEQKNCCFFSFSVQRATGLQISDFPSHEFAFCSPE